MNLTAGDNELDFKVNVLWWDLDTSVVEDRERIGTLGLYEVNRIWDYT
jgi:hypothetical protein